MMRDDTAVELVRNLYDRFGRGDLAGLTALLNPDVDWTWHGPAAIPYAGSRRGHTGVAEFFRAVAEAIVIEQFAPKQFIADGDMVVVIGDEKARAHATARCFAVRMRTWIGRDTGGVFTSPLPTHSRSPSTAGRLRGMQEHDHEIVRKE